MSNPKITLSDVAVRAGMSKATASRALRGLKVHRRHQGKAEAAAAELGYVLNESARALRSVRTMTVGMVYHDLTSMLGMELLRSVTSGLDEVGYSLFVSTAQGKNEKFDKLVHRLLQRRVDALVCVHGDGEGQSLSAYEAAGIPVMAMITKRGGYRDLPMVAPTLEGASKDCLTRLRTLGHELVAILKPPETVAPVQGFVAAAKSKRVKLIQREVERAAFDPAEILRELMELSPRPTVVVAFQAEAVRLHEAAARLKIRIPTDLSIVAMRDRSRSNTPSPIAFSTLHLEPRRMGEVASQILTRWLVDDVALTGDQLVEVGSWIERDTTAAAPR